MSKALLLLIVCFVIFAKGECVGISSLLHRKTTTEQPDASVTTVASETATNDRVASNYFISHNVPKVDEGCKIQFKCKKKLKLAENPKPCLKFCAESIICENKKLTLADPGQCVELNEEMVAQEYNDCKKDEEGPHNVKIMQVAMIDFPCQPGYLPDSRGRCREVW